LKIEKVQRHTLKVLSGLLAISLWFYVLNSEPIIVEKKLPIEYILPKNMVLVSFSEREISVKLKGSKAFLESIFNNNEQFKVDVRPYFQSTGKNFRVKFYPTSLDIPFGVEVLELSPRETLVELDQLGSLEVPIKVHMIGDIPKDRRLKEIKLADDSLMVSGPVEILKDLKRVDTVPLDLSRMTKEEGAFNLEVVPLDPRLKIKDNDKVKVLYKTKKMN
jgi:YbbR domain-containing protein